MQFQPKNYDNLIGTPGFSEVLLRNHFTLYQGYVKNVNTLVEERANLLKEGNGGTPQYAELTRRFGWEFNGMRLHELYFGNMRPVRNQTLEASADSTLLDRTSNGVANGGSALQEDTQLKQNLLRTFGSFENWEKDFRAAGAMRGIGWVVLYHDFESKEFFNVWVNEHDMGHLAGCAPLLVLDVFEHAYTLDYGIKKADYIEAFFKAIDWNAAGARLISK